MKAKHSILLLSGLLCIAACSDNDNPAEPVSGESESTPFIHTAPEPDYSSVVCDAPVFVTESLFKMFYTRHHKWNYETYALSSLPHPSRIPFGVLSLKNTHPNTIANVTVWKKGENADKQKNQPVAKFRDAFIKGESAVCALEVGTYCIEYDQINEFDNSIYNSWVLDDITVTNGSDQESSTAYVSTANAKQTDKTE